MIVTRKSKVAFPEIGQLRKGTAKKNRTSKNGVKYQTFGDDLGASFRPVFYPGNEETVSKFAEIYGDKPEKIIVTLAFDDVDQVWDNWYEAYTSGRMVARTDGEKFIYWVDVKTGEKKVVNGEPYTPWNEGMPVGNDYKGNPIYAKEVGRLKVVIPALMRMAYFTVMTTSKYDCAHITEQLNGLKQRNNGRLAGIPLMLRRRPYEITWTKEDGSAQRVTKFLINLEPDPDWVKKMFRVMENYSLPGGENYSLPSGEFLVVNRVPDDKIDETEFIDDDELEDGEFIEDEPAAVQAAEQLGGVVETDLRIEPEKLKTFIAKKANVSHKGKQCSKEQRGLLVGMLNEIFQNSNAANQESDRKEFCNWLVGFASTKDIPDNYVLSMLDWIAAEKDSGGAYIPNADAVKEAHAALVKARKEAGQMTIL